MRIEICLSLYVGENVDSSECTLLPEVYNLYGTPFHKREDEGEGRICIRKTGSGDSIIAFRHNNNRNYFLKMLRFNNI